MIDPNELFYPAVDLLRRLIATPSISREENATADLIAAYLQEYGFTPHRTANNVWAIAPDYTPGRPTVLLNSHHDTVRPVEGWQGQAFNQNSKAGSRRPGWIDLWNGTRSLHNLRPKRKDFEELCTEACF